MSNIPTTETRVCLLTPAGRGAVAVVSVQGPQATAAVDPYFRAANRRSVAEQELNRIVYGQWGTADGEDLVICRLQEDQLEIHCHGGDQSSATIIADLVVAGCKQIDWLTWLAATDICPLAAQAQLALAESSTLRTAEILLDQYHGALSRTIRQIINDLRSSELEQASAILDELLDRSRLGLHLTLPWKVAIAGLPNVGKSSLMNTLAGFERAIVFDQPGTTRDIVSVTTAVEGWPVELSDTAGLHQVEESIESAGIELAKAHFQKADLIIWVLDATTLTDQSAWELANKQAAEVAVELTRKSTLLVANKTDLIDSAESLDADVIPTSTVTGLGIDQLLSAIANQLVPDAPESGAAVPFTPEQIALLQSAQGACDKAEIENAIQLLEQLLSS